MIAARRWLSSPRLLQPVEPLTASDVPARRAVPSVFLPLHICEPRYVAIASTATKSSVSC